MLVVMHSAANSSLVSYDYSRPNGPQESRQGSSVPKLASWHVAAVHFSQASLYLSARSTDQWPLTTESKLKTTAPGQAEAEATGACPRELLSQGSSALTRASFVIQIYDV